MTQHNETTLRRAAAIFGPVRTEHIWMQEAARLQSAMGALTDVLLRLQDGDPVHEPEASNAVTAAETALPAALVALERVKALLGMRTEATESCFFAVRTRLLDELEHRTAEAEARAMRPNPNDTAAGETLYSKQDMLELTLALFEQQQARRGRAKGGPHGTTV